MLGGSGQQIIAITTAKVHGYYTVFCECDANYLKTIEAEDEVKHNGTYV